MISVCMIMKNEEKNIEECLDRITAYACELIIVDTGSTDKSKQIALKYTDKVYDYKWNDDFAAARNFSISKASNEFVLIMDCDEYIEKFDLDKTERLMMQNRTGIGRMIRINEFSRGNQTFRSRERVSRIFSKERFLYEGIIHEQITSMDKKMSRFIDIPLEVIHNGYDGNLSTRTKKTDRNIKLLLKTLQRDGEDPYVLYQLGKAFFMKEQYTEAEDYFGKALYFDLDPKLEYVQDLVECYGYALLETKKFDVAIQLLNVYEDFAVTADFVFLAALILMNNAKWDEAVGQFLKAAGMKEFHMEGVNSYRAYYNIGVIYECLGEIKLAREYYSKCGSFSMAEERLREIEKGE